MNALLQCFFNIKELRNYYIGKFETTKINAKNHPLSYHFAKVLYELLYSDSKYITLHDFNQVISERNAVFTKNKAADATDLF